MVYKYVQKPSYNKTSLIFLFYILTLYSLILTMHIYSEDKIALFN